MLPEPGSNRIVSQHTFFVKRFFMPEPPKKAAKKKLLDLVRDAIRTKHYSIRTDRRCLRQLGPAFHPVPRQAPPQGCP